MTFKIAKTFLSIFFGRKMVEGAPFQDLSSLIKNLNLRFFIETTLIDADRARDFRTLALIHERVNAQCMDLIQAGGATADLQLILMHLRERIIRRVIALCSREMHRYLVRPPSKYAWFLAGSEGRGEPSFFTDQDNLIVYERGNSRRIHDYFKNLSEKINDRLSQVGFEACKGGVMARNEEWRGSLKQWQERLEFLFSSLKRDLGENLNMLMYLSVLLDARFSSGDRNLSAVFLPMILDKAKNNHRFMAQMAQIATLEKVAITVFRRFRLLDDEEHHGALNIKKSGILPLVNSIRLLSLKYEAQGPGSIQRVQGLEGMGVLGSDLSKEIQDGFYVLTRIRLQNQVNRLGAGTGEDDLIIPSELDPDEQENLRRALMVVERVKQRVYKEFYLEIETVGVDAQ
jgi:signal-transduction protein with cAMP-binding, CBS, and nucleotidyltransferase domain